MQNDNVSLTDNVSLMNLCEFSFDNSSSQTAVEYYVEQYNNGSQEIKKKSITYEELKIAYNRLSQILQSVTCSSNCVIGLFVQPCLELVIAILGIMKTQCIFAPLDVKISTDFFTRMINKAGMKYLIVHSRQQKTVEVKFGRFIEINTDFMKYASTEIYLKHLILFKIAESSQIRGIDLNMSNISYIVHTSGTTGVPKIITVPHKCIVSNIVHLAKLFHIDKSSKVAMVSPPTFDASIVEMFITLSNCATLIIPSEMIKSQPSELLNVLFKKAKITILQATPSLMRRFHIDDLRTVVFSETASLKYMTLGGESCPSCKSLREWINPDAINIQSDDSAIPIGIPLWKTFFEVRDETTNTVLCTISSPETPDCNLFESNSDKSYSYQQSNHQSGADKGITICGKLFIGGKDRFCHILGEKDHEFKDTGDIVNATIQNDKTLKLSFVGRCDSMVKRNGKKLNLLSMSKTICRIVNSTVCHVLPICDNIKGVQIVAFISPLKTSKSSQSKMIFDSSSQDMKRWTYECFQKLTLELEPFLMPDKIIAIDMVPITLHGKIDENELKRLYIAKQHEKVTTITKEIINEAVISILPIVLRKDMTKIDNIQKYSEKSFVQLGGDSFAEVLFLNCLETFLEAPIFKVEPNIMSILHNHIIKEFVELLAKKFRIYKEDSCLESQSKKRKTTLTDTNNPAINHLNSSEMEVVAIGRGRRLYHVAKNKNSVSTLNTLPAQHNVLHKMKLVWKYDTGKCIDASPLISFYKYQDGICYIGSHSHLFSAVSLRTGSSVWNHELPDRIESSACLVPVNNEGVVCVGCNDGCIYFFEALCGEISWKFQTGSHVKSSPCWLEGTSFVYVGSHDGFLYSLDIETRKCQWKINCDGGSVFSSPVTYQAPKQSLALVIIATLGGKVLSLSAVDGKLIWKYNVGKPVFSSPSVNEYGVCVGCVDCIVYFFDIITGEKLWSFQTECPIFSSPCFSEDGRSIAVGSHDGYLYNINSNDGSLVWSTRSSDKSPVYSTPFV
uniref:beta-alanine-activating enzyme-like n=1 Tax=Styela clava TaxID=7725 RepID=UPI001939323A